MTTYVCKNQFQVSNSSTSPIFSTTTSPNIYGNGFSPKMEQQKRSRDREYLSTPDSAISINDNSSLSPKIDYESHSPTTETVPSNNTTNNIFYHQQPSSYNYSEYHMNGIGSAANRLNISVTKDYLHNVIGFNHHDPYTLPPPPLSSNPLVQLESFTKEALSNVTPFPKSSLPLPVDCLNDGKSSSGFIKPPCSYPCLIAIALHNAVTNRLNVSELYEFIQYYFPFFQRAPEGWKNSVRHNLSTNGWFNKVDEGRSGYAGRRSFLWGFTNLEIKDKAINDVRKQVTKKYKDMCDSIICSSLLEPLLNGERSFYPNSCHQSPFIISNGNGLNNYVKIESGYSSYNNRDINYHSQQNFSTTSPINDNHRGSRKRRSSTIINSGSLDETRLNYSGDSTSSYQPDIKKQFEGSRSFTSSNTINQLSSQDFSNYMLPYSFPFSGDGSQRQFNNLYRQHQQQQSSTYSPTSDSGCPYPLSKSPSVSSSHNGTDFYPTNFTLHSGGYSPITENNYDKEKGDNNTNSTSIPSGSSPSTISSNEQRTNNSWNQSHPSTSTSSSSQQQQQQQTFGSLERTSTKNDPFIDEVLNEFFLST